MSGSCATLCVIHSKTILFAALVLMGDLLLRSTLSGRDSQIVSLPVYAEAPASQADSMVQNKAPPVDEAPRVTLQRDPSLNSALCPREEDGSLASVGFPYSLVDDSIMPMQRVQVDARILATSGHHGQVCEEAWSKCRRLFNTSDSPLHRYREDDVIDTDESVRGLPFMHLAKTGGTAVEAFLGLPHWGHSCMSRMTKDVRHRRSKHERSRNASSAHFFAQLRHPIDRLASDYFFKLSGKEQSTEERQQQLCKEGTGKAYGKDCIPKVSFFEFAKLTHGPATSNGGRDYLFHCLRQDDDVTAVGEVIRFLMSEAFVLIGITDHMVEFQLMISQIFGLDKGKVKKERVKANSRKAVEELLTPEEYEELVHFHSKDIELYYWGLRNFEMMRQCYGVHKLAAEVRAVNSKLRYSNDLIGFSNRYGGVL